MRVTSYDGIARRDVNLALAELDMNVLLVVKEHPHAMAKLEIENSQISDPAAPTDDQRV